MDWKIIFSKSAVRDIDILEPSDKEKISRILSKLLRFLELGKLPRLDIKKMRGKWRGFLRLRTGDLRIIFRLMKEEKLIFVVRVGKRKKVYR